MGEETSTPGPTECEVSSTRCPNIQGSFEVKYTMGRPVGPSTSPKTDRREGEDLSVRPGKPRYPVSKYFHRDGHSVVRGPNFLNLILLTVVTCQIRFPNPGVRSKKDLVVVVVGHYFY